MRIAAALILTLMAAGALAAEGSGSLIGPSGFVATDTPDQETIYRVRQPQQQVDGHDFLIWQRSSVEPDSYGVGYDAYAVDGDDQFRNPREIIEYQDGDDLILR